MSDWRLDLKDLYDVGGVASTSEWGTYGGVRALKDFGLATCDRDPKDRRHFVYRITPRGTAIVEGRLLRELQGPRRPRWRSTWLSSLPSGIRITPRVCGCGRAA